MGLAFRMGELGALRDHLYLSLLSGRTIKVNGVKVPKKKLSGALMFAEVLLGNLSIDSACLPEELRTAQEEPVVEKPQKKKRRKKREDSESAGNPDIE